MDIKKGDSVYIQAGKDRRKTGKVLHANPAARSVTVEGLNVVKKHVRARKQGESGQIVSVPRPIPVSRLMVVCRSCDKPTRIARELRNEKRVRVCKRCKSVID